MRTFITQLKNKPEQTRKRIFFATMAIFIIVVFGLYLFSIKNSITYSLNEQASAGQSLTGEFHLPGLWESISVNAGELWKSIHH